ncbi:DUF4123 domain-containing protein [Paraburkholderia sp. J94]|uniref:DUF4123 domain-containing protein n=1 Tax=Paraburkholderia sp. J94 TaxID=2805441 RepID=UPI002AAFA90A|nr:DUF4123 domain-containing protein [Paraburkholderia sp. J94]
MNEQDIQEDVVNARQEEWPAWLSGLRAKLTAYVQADIDARLYLLVDTRGYQNLHERLANETRLRHVSLWKGIELEEYPEISPYLIEFDPHVLFGNDEAGLRMLEQLWCEAVDLYALTWIWSPFSIEQVDAHLRRYVMYELPNGRAYYLFFFDNHVLPRLRQVWSEKQAREFIGPFVEMGYRTRRLEEATWRNELPPTLTRTVSPLSAEQHDGLLQLGYADKLALKFRVTMGTSLDHLSDIELYEQTLEQLERSGRYRITGDESLSAYVMTGLLIGPRFDEHPAVQAQLAAVMRKEMDAAQAFEAIDDATWDEIRAG